MFYKAKVLIPIIAGVVLIGYLVIYSGLIPVQSKRASSPAPGEAAVQTAHSFVGGTYEASGIAHVPGTNGYLFVDDGLTSEVLWMQLDGDGKQTGSIVPVKIGVTVPDPEGITTDGTYFFVVGSQAKSKNADQAGIIRFRFNPSTHTAEDVQSLNGLRQYLLDNVAELRGLGSKKSKDEGISIEGLAWDPDRRALLVGLRSPVIDGNALLVPLKMRDSSGRFAYDNLETGKVEAIRVPIGGMGIRSIEYDKRQGLFHIIAGATESQDKTDFKLWQWSGAGDGTGLREITTFDRKLQPEGVASAASGDSNFTVIVFDSSRYLKMPWPE